MRMDILRTRHAYSIVAVLRSTALRRVANNWVRVHHRHSWGESGSLIFRSPSVVTGIPLDCSFRISMRGHLVQRAPKLAKTSPRGGLDRPFHSMVRVRPAAPSDRGRRDRHE